MVDKSNESVNKNAGTHLASGTEILMKSISRRVGSPPKFGRYVSATTVVSEGERSKNAQKSIEGSKTLLSKKPEGREDTVRFAVAFERSDVFTKTADPARREQLGAM